MAHSISFPPPCTLSVTRAPKESLLQHDAARSNLHFSFEQTDSSCCLRLSLARSVPSEVCKCDDPNMQSLTHSDSLKHLVSMRKAMRLAACYVSFSNLCQCHVIPWVQSLALLSFEFPVKVALDYWT